jgi:hypothetical protein
MIPKAAIQPNPRAAMTHLMSFPRQLGRAFLFFVGSIIAIPCIFALASFPADQERASRRKKILHDAVGIVERRLSTEGILPTEVTLPGEFFEARISVTPWDFHKSSFSGNTPVRPKPSETKNAYNLTYSWSNGDGVDTFDSITRKSSLDDYPSLLKRLMASSFFLLISYACFQTARSAYQGETNP